MNSVTGNGERGAVSDMDREEQERAVVLYAIGASVQAARLRRHWSIELAAEKAGIAHVTWRRVEDGKKVRAATYGALDRFFELPPGTFQRATMDADGAANLDLKLNPNNGLHNGNLAPAEVVEHLARGHKVGAVEMRAQGGLSAAAGVTHSAPVLMGRGAVNVVDPSTGAMRPQGDITATVKNEDGVEVATNVHTLVQVAPLSVVVGGLAARLLNDPNLSPARQQLLRACLAFMDEALTARVGEPGERQPGDAGEN
jgi:hypothetical protein